ncbi:Dabb family protein [Paenibacillus sp. N4]|uniref:Dabb family protein n=1 Tax=Paenibacillus vietnamensis TaxID=2590547 RepID=UPI001CD141C5|nr:Dabb family protein [Paenibacillus vietnamensis]MCA0753627.1 Dabb family protein [Paenibacillus vietnamensis]
MYEHLVSFKFREPLDQGKERELLDALHALKEAVPGIVELTAGANQTPETDNIQGYTLGLRVTFAHRQALLDYGPHPAHQAFVRLLDGLIDNVIVVDYPVHEVHKRG